MSANMSPDIQMSITGRQREGRTARGEARMALWAAYALIAVGSLVMLAPLYFMFVFATHSRTEIFDVPPPLFFGHNLVENVTLLSERVPFWRSLGWSLYIALASTGLTLLFCSMAGYAFGRFEF